MEKVYYDVEEIMKEIEGKDFLGMSICEPEVAYRLVEVEDEE